MSERVTRGTGIYGDVDPDPARFARRLAQLDKGPGFHLWVYVGAWAAADPRAVEAQLDGENLVSLTGPGCYKCEQPFSNRVARRPCRGSLDLQ